MHHQPSLGSKNEQIERIIEKRFEFTPNFTQLHFIGWGYRRDTDTFIGEIACQPVFCDKLSCKCYPFLAEKIIH